LSGGWKNRRGLKKLIMVRGTRWFLGARWETTKADLVKLLGNGFPFKLTLQRKENQRQDATFSLG